MVKTNIKMGKLQLPLDVRSPDSIPAFEDLISKGPMAIVLVYADWCGHCPAVSHTFHRARRSHCCGVGR